MSKRKAVVTSAPPSELETVRAYLPSNYTAEVRYGRIYIEGEDDHGWTLDGYVIPRLASGLIVARPVRCTCGAVLHHTGTCEASS